MKPLAWGLTVEATGDPNAATPIPTARRLWPVPLRVRHVDIFALPGNTNRIYIGDMNVSAISGTQAGTPMSANDVKSYDDVDLSMLWITAVIVGEGVSCEAELEDDAVV
jgi:hypothetical protein